MLSFNYTDPQNTTEGKNKNAKAAADVAPSKNRLTVLKRYKEATKDSTKTTAKQSNNCHSHDSDDAYHFTKKVERAAPFHSTSSSCKGNQGKPRRAS